MFFFGLDGLSAFTQQACYIISSVVEVVVLYVFHPGVNIL